VPAAAAARLQMVLDVGYSIGAVARIRTCGLIVVPAAVDSRRSVGCQVQPEVTGAGFGRTVFAMAIHIDGRPCPNVGDDVE
jgi:hypothetical protein